MAIWFALPEIGTNKTGSQKAAGFVGFRRRGSGIDAEQAKLLEALAQHGHRHVARR
ncbi:hypothetical protein GCM10023333_02180 [Ferrimonas pelagia]|uniref:Transposase n=1 Tax=Ferrimonas pelagia TaxID=1177826 RepID=A0ABP9EHS9_9GAMM